MKPNGKLYLHTPNPEFFLEIMKNKNIFLKQFPDHVSVRTPSENIDMIEKSGFKITKVKLISQYTIAKLLHPLSYIPWIGKYFKARNFIEAIS